MARVHKKHKSFYTVLPIIIVILVLLIVIPKVLFKIDMIAVIWGLLKSIWFIAKYFLYILLGICVIAYLYYLLSGKAAKEKQEIEENRIALEVQKAKDREKLNEIFIEPTKQRVETFKNEHLHKEEPPVVDSLLDKGTELPADNSEQTMNLF